MQNGENGFFLSLYVVRNSFLPSAADHALVASFMSKIVFFAEVNKFSLGRVESLRQILDGHDIFSH